MRTSLSNAINDICIAPGETEGIVGFAVIELLIPRPDSTAGITGGINGTTGGVLLIINYAYIKKFTKKIT